MSLSFGSRNIKQNSTGQQDPWEVAIPGITDVIDRTRTAGADLGNISERTGSSFETLFGNAGAGNPYAGDIDSLTRDLFATPDRTGEVSGAFDTLNRRLSPTAEGGNLNLRENPFIQEALQYGTDDAVNRINSQFAGAGRDLSGVHQQAVARGVNEAQIPVLAGLYTQEQGRTDAAARDLFSAETGAATTSAGLDAGRSALRGQGIATGQAAIDAGNYGPERTLQLEEAFRTLPMDELQRLAEILFTAGGLGQQTQGTAKGSMTSMGGQFNLATALSGGMFPGGK